MHACCGHESMTAMAPPPIGYVYLYQAVDVAGRRVRGADWVPICCQDWLKYLVYANLVDDVIRTIAEACEAGKLAAAYRSIAGADDLDPRVWRSPAWQNYFAIGTIDLELPLLDERSRPSKEGFTARCTREIFIRHTSLMSLFAEQGPLPQQETTFRRAVDKVIRNEVRVIYVDPRGERPNVNEIAKIVRPRLNAQGCDASDRQIRKIAEEPEFSRYRRPPGKTKASDRRQ
jgi:hypothetical protein